MGTHEKHYHEHNVTGKSSGLSVHNCDCRFLSDLSLFNMNHVDICECKIVSSLYLNKLYAPKISYAQ